MSNKKIAGELTIAVHTAKSHIHSTLEQLSLQTHLALAGFALTDTLVGKTGE